MANRSLRCFERARTLTDSEEPFVLVTLVDCRGYAPQDLGARAIITKDGLVEGTVGGGRVEAKAILRAKEILEEDAHQPELVRWNLQRDVGMSCGGEVTYFFEKFLSNAWEVVVFGAGHVSQAVVRLLLTLDCRIKCIDFRSEWLERLPDSKVLEKVLVPDGAAMADEVGGLSKTSYILCITQGHKIDFPILKVAMEKNSWRYIGVIGSKVKAGLIRKELAEAGVSTERIEDLRCPMGLDLGSNDPSEIAVSIVAELLQVRDLRGLS